ncbi:MAG: right-handed parallel beta-helix repeat-containing protein, partial [Planctomycetota bacterium]
MAAGTFLKATLVTLLFILVVGVPAAAGGQILYVDDDGPAGFNKIQAAIDLAVDGDVVIVAEGRYFENINFNGKNITLRSTEPNDPNVTAATIIDGRNSGTVVTFNNGEDANCVLNGFTITNGYAERGGGIYCFGSSPKLTNCTFSSNSSGHAGGGMYNYKANPILTDCTFIENSADFQG